jgi:transcriptional regulator
MYLPKAFEITDLAPLHALVREHPLAAWATVVDGEPLVNHVPFLLDATRGERGTLIGHVARANPVWQRGGGPGVLVFQGADAYVTPNWYPGKHVHGKAVPTWNYAVVHAHGQARFSEDRALLRRVVTALTAEHEAAQPRPWTLDDAPPDYIEQMLGAIVAVEIPVQRWVGKFKLSQNQPATNREGVIHGLRQQGTDGARAMADGVLRHAPR